MQYLIALVFVSIGVWGNGHAQAAGIGDTKMVSCSRSFLELRGVQGHFGGGPWNAAVDAWDGTKHRTMQCIAAHAITHALKADRLRVLMGAPDETLRCPSDACSAMVGQADWKYGSTPGDAAGELWVYHWRGRHDRLVFAFTRDVVRGGGWLYVHE